RGAGVEYRDEVARQTVGMNGDVVVGFLFAVADGLLESDARLADLAYPGRVLFGAEVRWALVHQLDHLPQHQLGVADDGHRGRDVAAEACRRWIDLDILGLRAPGRRLAELLATPEAEADGDHDVRLGGERLLPGAAHRQRVG